MTDRDELIIRKLKQFRVLSRDQIGSIACGDLARPWATVNRIMKRLSRDGLCLPIPQPKDRPYLYMPNPAFIHTQSSRIQHFLGLVDIYLLLGKPERFLVEPDIPNHAYRPDAITQLRDQRIVIEYQRSHISHKTMQEKVNNFVDSGDIHKSKELWIITDKSFKVEYPKEYTVQQFPLTEVKEKRVL